jgi:hypothetical protein
MQPQSLADAQVLDSPLNGQVEHVRQHAVSEDDECLAGPTYEDSAWRCQVPGSLDSQWAGPHAAEQHSQVHSKGNKWAAPKRLGPCIAHASVLAVFDWNTGARRLMHHTLRGSLACIGVVLLGVPGASAAAQCHVLSTASSGLRGSLECTGLCHNAAGFWGCQASALQHVALCCNHCVMTAINACNPNTARQQVLHLNLPRTCKRDTFQLGHASAAVRSRTVIRQLLLHIKSCH